METYVPVEVTLGPLVVDKEIQVIGLVRDITERKKAEEEMRMSELILQNSSDSIITTDLQGKIISWNKGATEIFGYSAKEALGENIAKIVKQVERERIAPTQLETVREGKVFAGEWEDIRKDGSSVWLLLTTTLLLNSKNEPVGMVGFGKDISKRKQIEADLLKSKFLLSETEKTGKIGGWEFDVNTLTQSWTEETFRILEIDLSQGEPTVPKGIDFINHPYRSMANEAIKRAIEHGEPYDQKWEITTMKGNKRWVHAVAKANRENNKIRSISGSFQDITESKHTEEKLRQSEERFWQLFSSMPSGVSVYEAVDDGEDFVFRDYNAAAEKIDRISRDNVVGKRVTQAFPGVKAFGLFEVFQRVWRTGQTEYFPAAMYMDDRDPGSWRENWVYKLPNGNIVAVFNDITEHKKTEAEVLWLASFPALNPNPIVEVDLEGNISYVNSATESIFPDLKKEGLGHPFFSGWQQVVAAFKDGKQQTFSRDIEIGDVWFSQQIQFVHETRHVRIYATNITAAKKAEQETLQTKHLLEAHITNSPLAVIEFDSQYRVTRWSSEAENVFGWSADEVVEKAINEIPWVYKEDAKIVEELSMNMVEGKRSRNMNTNRNYRKDGSVIWCEWYNSAIYDKQGKMVSVLSRVLDITERKETEEKLSQTMDQLVLVNEKLSVVGSLTRHDVGNKLMVVKSNLYLLKKQIGDNPKLVKYFEGIDSALDLSNKMFEYSRLYELIGSEKPSRENAFECFNQAAALLPNLGTTIKTVNDCHGLEVMADSLLKQLFYNFLDNSLKHGEKVTQIRLHYTKESDELKLFYEDNGVGIPLANKSKLFDSGFTTGNGSGLGLYLVKKMMDVYGWSIQEVGEPGKGAKFTITIPKLNNNGKENYQIVPIIE